MSQHSSIARIALMQPCLLACALSIALLPVKAQPIAPVSLAQPALSIAQAPAVPQTRPIAAVAEEFANLMVQGDFVQAWQYIHPSLRTSWSPVDMQESWHDLQDRTGAFKQFTTFREDGETVVLADTQFEKVSDNLVIIFDDTRQWIVGVDFPQE
ncbi:MAG: DUF3887 domain-containing protein [Oscillatoriophycideae cyanobacterium NC_groundwater_1537_Pr4_S-0.65um_50_18]|nr:DUF3887 domain-containing protein [Oscillatoriophycideae cyanobacterium NC_groundwater_1537_Pr4_S-0.65um_50_18]